MGGQWGGGVQQSGPDTKHFEVVCPALSCQLVWPGSGHCDLRPWCCRELCPGCLSSGPVQLCFRSVCQEPSYHLLTGEGLARPRGRSHPRPFFPSTEQQGEEVAFCLNMDTV